MLLETLFSFQKKKPSPGYKLTNDKTTKEKMTRIMVRTGAFLSLFAVFPFLETSVELPLNYLPLKLPSNASNNHCSSVFIPLITNAPFLYLLDTKENHKVFWCFQGVEKGCIGNKWVNPDCEHSFISALPKPSRHLPRQI